MSLFTQQQEDVINAQAAKSQQLLEPKVSVNSKSINDNLNTMSSKVLEYYKDSKAILITEESELSSYIDDVIEAGYCGIDTETTGLDRRNDYIVGMSLYYPGGVECYIPFKHMIPLFDEPRKNQMTYEQVSPHLNRLVENKVKLILANADFDLAMIYNSMGVDLVPAFYYDVILAWRCLKENERDNSLKGLYWKYILKEEGDKGKFSDFFTPSLFPYCEPKVAKLYAANDAKITYELFIWQLPYATKDNPKCIKNNLQQVADLIWNIEFPLVTVCQELHRVGVYLEKSVADKINKRYGPIYVEELAKLHGMVQEVSDNPKYMTKTRKPWSKVTDFNPDSSKHVPYLLYDMLKLDGGKGRGADKEILSTFNLPITNQILACRSLKTVISTFVDKLPREVWDDGRVHCNFKQTGAATGRFSSENPNMQNIPSKRTDIRLMFRATPGYVLLSSDYSAQEPRLTAYCANDEKMIQAFIDGKDIYGSIGAIAFGVPYEEALENWPDGTPNPAGKARRASIKTVLLGAMYGRSTETIAEQLYGDDTSLTRDEMLKKGQAVQDSVMFACPALRSFMINTQNYAKKYGFVQTILGRRRHIPEMQLPEFEFKAMPGYVNPDVDPMDLNTMTESTEIPERVVEALTEEFAGLKYFGQIMKRIRELNDHDKIKVINNRHRISEASRKCVNSIIQGSAADQTKIAMLEIFHNQEWKDLGARLLIPVHDELIAEVPIENYERAVELLSELMRKAADFLPFPSKCDVTVSYRWYGQEFPCPYPKPNSLNNMTDEEIRWLKYHLFEAGYKVKVDAEYNDVCQEFVKDYIQRNHISKDNFIQHIYNRVHLGVV